MRKGAVLVLVLLAATFSVALFAADKRDITVVNKAGEPITELYISLANDMKWGEDILGVDVLNSGESVDIHFSGYAKKDCLFDVLAKNKAGEEWLLEDLDLCEVSTIKITPDNIKAK
jgi:hypothetical protein